MKTGLFFGSFNPVHIGHMIIASHMVQYTDLSQVWMVISPQNPLKQKSSLARGSDRLHLVRLAIGDHPNIIASSIEFSLPVPSYTVDTLTYLKEKYPDRTFSLIMGQDNYETLDKWKNYTYLLENHEIYIYPRPGYQKPTETASPGIHFLDMPTMNISSSYIRNAIKSGKSVQYLVPDAVFEYLELSGMYRK
jgi:nicotinate-nucleotide adenylyltransferase